MKKSNDWVTLSFGRGCGGGSGSGTCSLGPMAREFAKPRLNHKKQSEFVLADLDHSSRH